MDNLNYVFPEIFIALAIMFLLVFGVFKKNSSKIVHSLSIFFLLITAVLIFDNPFDNAIKLFNESYIIDYLSFFMKILILLGGVFVLIISSCAVHIINASDHLKSSLNDLKFEFLIKYGSNTFTLAFLSFFNLFNISNDGLSLSSFMLGLYAKP